MTLLTGGVSKTARLPQDRHAAARVLVWLIALLAGGAEAFAADEFRLPWRWSNPFPHGNNIYDIALRAGGDVQVADRGQIYVRTNEFSWVPAPSGVERALRGVAYFGDQIVITGESGTILRGTVAGGFGPAVITPATEDWLEAVAASPAVAVAVGDNAAIYTSADGAQWQRVSNLPFTDWLRGVAYDDGTFVVVGENGLIATSTDGRQWRRRTSGVTTHLNRVASRSGVFHAVGEGGVSLVGRNGGATWNSESVGLTNSLFTATANVTQRVVAGDAALRMKTGNNGAWIDQLGDGSLWPAPAWTYFAAAWNGEAFEVAGRTGMMVEGFRSEDGTGTLWVPADESPRHWLWEVARVGDQYLAVGDRATVMTSPNGVDWFEEMIPSTLTNAVLLGVGGSTNLLVAVGDSGNLMVSRGSLTNVVTTNEVVSFVNCLPVTNSVPVTNLVNLLGLAWEPVSPAPTANTLQGVAERAGLVVVVGDAGTVLTTRDGRDWALSTIPGQPNLSSVAAAEAGFVATGAAGAIYFSLDGASWSSRGSGTTNWIYRVRHLEGQFVAVGQNGTLLTSPDAAMWTPRASGSIAWLTDVTFTGSRYFVTGTQGTVLTSIDAHDWDVVPVVTGKSLYGAASAGGQLVVVGVEGVILRALTDPRAPVNIAQFSQQECAEAGLSRLTFQGSVEQRFRLEYSDDLEHWNIIREFELLEPQLPFEYASAAKPTTGYRFFRTSLLAP